MQQRVVLRMRPGRYPAQTGHLRTRRAFALAAGVLLSAAGCDAGRLHWPVGVFAPQPATDRIAEADTPFTPLAAALSSTEEPRPPAAVLTLLSVLHVQIPRDQRVAAEKVWSHLREDVLDSEAMLRLRRNGVRVGIGRAQSWEAIKVALDALRGQRVQCRETVRLPPAFPLALELDTQPRDQTLFFVANDGVLSGDTWPQSRNVLLVTCGPDARRRDGVQVFVAPEVRQRLPGWRWVRTEAGLWQTPKQSGKIFHAVEFRTTLAPGEFVLVAPSSAADVSGLIGGALLVSEEDGRRYDSYVFLRPERSDVIQPD